jgi:ribosome-binding protein aMBF1 (putative translation factor)
MNKLDFNRRIAKNITQQREELGWSKGELARKMQFHQTSRVTALESGDSGITTHMLYRLCKIFKCEATDILRF